MEGRQELDEALEKAREPMERRVGATMAIIAAILALVSVSGHVLTTEELLLQQRAADQWAYYQSKSIRRYQSEATGDVLSALKGPEAAQKYAANTERYQKDAEKIQEQARDLERESRFRGSQALRLHVGEVLLEIAIVFSSLAILTRRRFFWHSGMAGALAGAVIALSMFTL